VQSDLPRYKELLGKREGCWCGKGTESGEGVDED